MTIAFWYSPQDRMTFGETVLQIVGSTSETRLDGVSTRIRNTRTVGTGYSRRHNTNTGMCTNNHNLDIRNTGKSRRAPQLRGLAPTPNPIPSRRGVPSRHRASPHPSPHRGSRPHASRRHDAEHRLYRVRR